MESEEGNSDNGWQEKIMVIQDMAVLDYLDFEMINRDNRSILSDNSMRLPKIEMNLIDTDH